MRWGPLQWLRNSAERSGLIQLLAPSLAADTSLLDKLAVPVIGAIGVITVAVITLIGTYRSSGRTAQVQRDNELDQRADRQNERLMQELVRVTALLEIRERERDAAVQARDQARETLGEYREKYAALRVRVRHAGLDPDTLGENL
ncbi:hypothetical protein [Actinoplanes derwentensis]|uniref:Uncharacterized protein n=1 Tax=Actinoplanes derwentensis TaxID=113562 RepID=A0A1H2CVL5_9ACTN|nr:hypothetical protein [Actinoplanes derwentensis]GID82031.1 hypothetical protein Ade03nite_09550 [Actinoplanes derwentensis]SDT74414.1 hypothetical protein SAMN04489716_6974 [Actinoplanes derwentensis]